MASRAPLPMNPLVVSPLQLLVAQLLGHSQSDYGTAFADVGLRLDGGTALASYYLGHRESDDLDFFGAPTMHAADVAACMRRVLEEAGLHLDLNGGSNAGYASLIVIDPGERDGRPLKLDVCRASSFALDAPQETVEGIPVASYRDVCAGKMHALCDRFEPRDFVDLHAILARASEDGPPPAGYAQRNRIRELINDLCLSDPGLSALEVAKALERGVDRPVVTGLPLRLLTSVTDDDVQAVLKRAATEARQVANTVSAGPSIDPQGALVALPPKTPRL